MPEQLEYQILRTDKISPKAVMSVVVPVVFGLALLLLDKLLLDDEIDDELWLGMILGGPVAGVGAYSAKPGNVIAEDSRRNAKEELNG